MSKAFNVTRIDIESSMPGSGGHGGEWTITRILLKSQATVRSVDPLEEVSSCGRIHVFLTGDRVMYEY